MNPTLEDLYARATRAREKSIAAAKAVELKLKLDARLHVQELMRHILGVDVPLADVTTDAKLTIEPYVFEARGNMLRVTSLATHLTYEVKTLADFTQVK